ncbi:MAG: hypothetical protein J7L15_01215, partial [Clostridiales bacterium]|nr:hypothetical protein [Clostridiales bacterium]
MEKINKIKVMGEADVFVFSEGEGCDVIKKEDVKCKKAFNTKNCVYNCGSKICDLYKCFEYKEKQYKISNVKATDIRIGDYFLISFDTKEKQSIIKNKYQARFAGHLASDGSVSKKYKESRICMNKEEINYVFPCIEQVYKRFGAEAKLSKCSSPQVFEARSSRSDIFNFSTSLVKSKGKDKKFTQEVLFLKRSLQLHVIGAYIQSDGTFNKINKCVEITTYSKYLASQLLTLCFRCGILARANKQPISMSEKTFKTKNIFRYIINISSSECNKIKKYVPGKIKISNF